MKDRRPRLDPGITIRRRVVARYVFTIADSHGSRGRAQRRPPYMHTRAYNTLLVDCQCDAIRSKHSPRPHSAARNSHTYRALLSHVSPFDRRGAAATTSPLRSTPHPLARHSRGARGFTPSLRIGSRRRSSRRSTATDCRRRFENMSLARAQTRHGRTCVPTFTLMRQNEISRRTSERSKLSALAICREGKEMPSRTRLCHLGATRVDAGQRFRVRSYAPVECHREGFRQQARNPNLGIGTRARARASDATTMRHDAHDETGAKLRRRHGASRWP